MSRIGRLTGSISLISFSLIYLLSYGNVSAHGPFTHRIIVSPSKLPASSTRVAIENGIESLPLWMAYVRTIQEVTGLYFNWIKIPSALLLSVFIYSILSPLPKQKRIIATFASVGGPLLAMSYTFQFRRYYLDIGIMLCFVLLILIDNRRSGNSYYVPLVAVFSILLWFIHYTFWPFFAIFAAAYSIIYSDINRRGVIVVFSLLLGPFIIHSRPATAYLSVLPVFLFFLENFNIWDPIGSLLSITKGQSPISADFPMTVPAYSGTPPTWLSEVLHGMYLFPLLGLVFIWFYANYKTGVNVTDLITRSPAKISIEKALVISVAIAFVITSFFYLSIGYAFRIFTFFPIVFPLFIREVWLSMERKNQSEFNVLNRTNGVGDILKTISISLLLIISILHFGPVFPYQYIDNDQPAVASSQQIAASKYVEQIPDSESIYSDMLHKSVIVTTTHHVNVKVGKVTSLDSGRNGLDIPAAALFDPEYSNGDHILLTHRNTGGMILRGGVTDLPNHSRFSLRCSTIYENGMDAMYVECD